MSMEEWGKRKAWERLWTTWQRQWIKGTDGGWTITCIPNIRPWIERRHGEVGYYLTQALSRHGCLGEYLYDIRKAGSRESIYSVERDDPYHTIFRCNRWDVEREEYVAELEAPLNIDTMARLMLTSERKWKAVELYIRKIMRQKEEDDKEIGPNS